MSEDNQACGHKFKDFECCKNPGHDGEHWCFEDTGYSTECVEMPETDYLLHIWNDKGETP